MASLQRHVDLVSGGLKGERKTGESIITPDDPTRN